jgi:hypothetical protein
VFRSDVVVVAVSDLPLSAAHVFSDVTSVPFDVLLFVPAVEHLSTNVAYVLDDSLFDLV